MVAWYEGKSLGEGKRANRHWFPSSALKFKGLLWEPRRAIRVLGMPRRETEAARSAAGTER